MNIIERNQIRLVNSVEIYSDKHFLMGKLQIILLDSDSCPAESNFDSSPGSEPQNKNYRDFWMHLNTLDPGGIFHRATDGREKVVQLTHGPIK